MTFAFIGVTHPYPQRKLVHLMLLEKVWVCVRAPTMYGQEYSLKCL